MKQIFFHSKVKYIVLFIYGLLIPVIFNSLNGNWLLKINYCNSFFVSGFTIICFGILSLIFHQGTFDMFSYMFARKNEFGKRPSYYDYMQDKKVKRGANKFYYVPYFTLGVFYLIIALCLL